MAPSALPEGVSPDCQDVDFLPGSVYSRPCLHKVFGTPFPPGGPNNVVPTVVYGKSFVTATGAIKNLYLDSNGVLWVEDFTNSPGTYTQLLQTAPGSFAKSVTAFGREWLAFSDGLHGTDAAYQYDGTNLDRVTQDAPGAPPVISMVTLPSSSITASTSVGVTIGTVKYESTEPNTLSIILASFSTIFYVGERVTIAGNSVAGFNVSGTILAIGGIFGGSTSMVISSPTLTTGTGTGGTLSGPAATLSRSGNIVTATTTTAHGLQVGYQQQISGVATTAVGGGVNSIAIKNNDLAGEATVTTNTAHGLAPGESVTITGVTPTSVGGGIAAAVRHGELVTLTTNTAHGLVPGAVTQIAGVTDATFNATITVAQVPSPTQIAYAQVAADASSSGGTVSLTWPIPDNTITPTYFEVLTCPTVNSFTVQVTYSDGTWTSGTVQFAWDGIFYVTSILSAVRFQYQQFGPDATTSTAGTVTPHGQIAPGTHLMQVLFLNRQGNITAPSPPISFIANGAQYAQVSNIPTGPGNIVARILAFTGAQPNVPGILPPFFYIPVPAQVQGLTVSTATQIDDNATTSALLDFSDNTLFAAIGINVTGNTPANQIVLDGALGFSYFQSRMTTFGQRNRIQNLLAMSFGGGIFPGTMPYPLGWQLPTNSTGGAIVAGIATNDWRITANFADTIGTSGNLQQPAYADASSAPIVEGNKIYKIRCRLSNFTVSALSLLSVQFYMTSASTGFSSTATIAGSAVSLWQSTHFGYFEATFGTRTPLAIPTDLVFGFYAHASTFLNVTFQIGDLSLIDAEQPYLDDQSFTSYVNNPAAFDGVTGNMQPTEDTRKIMDFSILRGTPYAHTQDPSGRLHEILVNPTSEPIGWAWKEVSANCGTLSAFGVTKSQADDYTGSGGDDWLAWPSEGGATIFDGSEPKKISQEIQPSWNDPTSTAWPQIYFPKATTAWAMNDPVRREIYFGLPILNSRLTTPGSPNIIYTLSYRELNSAYAIANSPPFHPSLSGKLVATDNTRKWSPWTMTINGAARMYRSAGQLSTVFFGGNGRAPGGSVPGFGNVYTLDSTILTDDDYGQVNPHYVTCFMVEPEKAAAIGLGSVRLMLAYLTAFVSGTGTVTYTFLCDSLSNPWSITTTRALTTSPRFDQEAGGGLAQGNRIAIKIASSPTSGTDNGFNLQRLQAFFKKAKMQIRGAAQ